MSKTEQIRSSEGCLMVTLAQAERLQSLGYIYPAMERGRWHAEDLTLDEIKEELAVEHHATNVEFVTDLMERSRHGGLIQAFVIQALDYYSKNVAARPPDEFDSPLMNGAAWHGCGVEIQEKLKARLK